MNIPQVPPEGWTRPFINQLRAIADNVGPGPTVEERRWLNEIWRTLSEDALDKLFAATRESFNEFERVEQVMLDDHKEPPWSPEKWNNYVVSDRRHRSFEIAALVRQLFGRTPGVQPQNIESSVEQLALL